MVEYLQRTKAKSVDSILFSRDSYRLETLPFFRQWIRDGFYNVSMYLYYLSKSYANFLKQLIYQYAHRWAYVRVSTEWKSKASSGKLKLGLLSGLSRRRAGQRKMFSRFSRNVNPEFSSVNRRVTLVRRAAECHRPLPLYLLCSSMKSKLAWGKLALEFASTQIPAARCRHFVIGEIEFSNGSKSTVRCWNPGSVAGTNERYPLFYGKMRLATICLSLFRSVCSNVFVRSATCDVTPTIQCF